MADYRRTRRAEADLIDIWLSIAADNQTAADRVLDQLDDRSRLLADQPKLGPARDDIAPGLRYLTMGSYLILYRIEVEGIEVVRYVHGARDLFALTLTD